jgi:DNA-binding GntR family transcriptional regulator
MRECVEMIDVAIKYKNFHDYYHLQRKFHDIYRDKCNNEILRKNLNGLLDGFIPQVYGNVKDKILFKALAELNDGHRHMADLFEGRDADGLFSFLMNVHWKPVYPEIL